MLRRLIIVLMFLLLSALTLLAQNEAPVFVNEGETLVYYVIRDEGARQGTVSDALQNVPGVKVDTEGNITLRGVDEVVLFINGKPSHFDSESLKNYLQQVKAVSIERIEVMTNPSARYSTEPDKGVINIVTSGDSHEQHLSIGLQTTTQPNISPWLSYIWSSKKLSFTANLKGAVSNKRGVTNGYSYSFVDHFVDSLPVGVDTSTFKRYHTIDTTSNYSVELFLKAEYHPDEKNDFMVFFNATPRVSRISSLSDTYRKEYLNDVGEYNYSILHNESQPMTFGSTGASWHHHFAKPGHSLGIQANCNFDFGGGGTNEIRTFAEQPVLNRNIRITNDFVDVGYDAKVEYTYPYSNRGEIYVSLSDELLPDNNICLYDTHGTDGYVTDPRRSENRKFSKNQLSGLVMLQHHFGRFTVKPAIGYETTWVRARYFDIDNFNFDRRFDHLLPSLHLSYRTASQHNFSLSYTRKTDYPWVRYFTNRVIFEEENFAMGNPKLQPTLIDVFEMSWAKYFDQLGSVDVKGYFNNSINAINQVSDVAYNDLWGRVVTYTKPVNLNRYYEVGGQFNITYRPNARFNVRLDANVYDSHIETFYEKTQDSVITSDLIAYNLRLSTWAKLMDKLELHVVAYYNSPTQTLFALEQTAYGINCGLRADFFDKRLSLLLNAYDIFNWNREDNYSFNPYYISYSSNRYNSRYVSLEVVYRIL